MAIVQFIVYFICGFFLLVMIAAMMSVGSGFDLLPAALAVSALILSGVCAGLSFFAPRAAAGFASAIAAVFLTVAVHDFIYRPIFTVPALIAVPSLLVTCVSVIPVIRRKDSFWSRLESPAAKIATAVVAAFPAFLVAALVLFAVLQTIRAGF